MTTWTPKTENSNSWTAESIAERVFDPFVFDRLPTFDTGTTGGIWDEKSQPTSSWTG